MYVDKDKGCKQKSDFISQLNDTAIPQPGAHLKARSSSKLQHSSDHCLVVASQTRRLHLKKKKKNLKRSIIPTSFVFSLGPSYHNYFQGPNL